MGTKAYSKDLRERGVKAARECGSARAAGEQFGAGSSTAVRWFAKWRETGALEPAKQERRRKPVSEQRKGCPPGLIEAKVDMTLEDARERLQSDRGVTVSVPTIWRFFRKRGPAFGCVKDFLQKAGCQEAVAMACSVTRNHIA